MHGAAQTGRCAGFLSCDGATSRLDHLLCHKAGSTQVDDTRDLLSDHNRAVATAGKSEKQEKERRSEERSQGTPGIHEEHPVMCAEQVKAGRHGTEHFARDTW
jgi:hypothetical protein